MLFWFAVVTENEYSYELEIPIIVSNLLPTKTLASTLPASARVRFEGRGKALLTLLFTRDAYLELDLATARNSFETDLKPDMVHVPRRNLTVTARQVLSPNTIALKISNLQSREVPIVAVSEVSTIAGYTVVGGVRVVPDSLVLSGPEELLRKIKAVHTKPLRAKEAGKSFSAPLELETFPDSTWIRLSFNQVEATVEVQKIIELDLQEIPVRVKNGPAHLKVTVVPSTLALTVEGGEKLLLNLKREEVNAFIDFAHAHDNEYEGHPPEIVTPPGVRYRNVKPSLFKLMMERGNNANSRH